MTNSTQGLEQAAEASGGRVVERLDAPQNRAVLLKFPTEQAAQAAADGLSKRADVQYVERNGIVEGTAVSSDPQVGFQWHHRFGRRDAATGAGRERQRARKRLAPVGEGRVNEGHELG